MLPRTIVDLQFGLNCGWERVKPWACFHRHDEVELTFFVGDTPVLYRFGGKLIEIRPNQTVLFWGAIPHQLVEIAPVNVQYWLTIPPAMLIRWELPETFVREVLSGVMLFDDDPTIRHLDLLTFAIWNRELKENQEFGYKTVALSVEARLRRFAAQAYSFHNQGGYPAKHLNQQDRDRFMTMYDYIATHFRDPICVEQIAAAANVHPNYGITLFKKKCGINIMDLVSLLRVFEAQRLLLTTEMKVIDIAMESGFASMSNFYKTFNKIHTKSPRQYRIEANTRAPLPFPCAFE